MKTNLNLVKISTLSVALLTVGVFAASNIGAQAQEKGGERLVNLSRKSATSNPVTSPKTSVGENCCPKCADQWTTVARAGGKGANITENKLIQKHDCSDCSTKIVTTGLGKNAKDIVKHECKGSAPAQASCCAEHGKGTDGKKSNPEASHHHE